MNEQRYRKKVTQNQVKSVLETMIANFILTALLCLTVSYSTIRKPARDVPDIENEIPVMTSCDIQHLVETRSPRPIYKGDKMDPSQLKKHIEYILIDMDMFSESAVDLLMLTCAQESKLGHYIEQIGGGPAKGIYQMELSTHGDIRKYVDRKGTAFWDNTIANYETRNPLSFTTDLTLNIAYQTAMARLHYWRVPAVIPTRDQFENKKQYIRALAEYWKQHWNTHLGAGTVDQAVSNYQKYVEGKA